MTVKLNKSLMSPTVWFQAKIIDASSFPHSSAETRGLDLGIRKPDPQLEYSSKHSELSTSAESAVHSHGSVYLSVMVWGKSTSSLEGQGAAV